MPRLPRIRLRALDDLARQLRFAPRPAAARHAAAVITLASEIDPDRAYAEDWIARRITGFRTEIDEPAQLVGRALLGDLSALAERLSAQSKIEESDLRGPLLRISELRKRWSVSARTIERYRRVGLIGVRVASRADGALLVFPESSIKRFEARHEALLRAAREYRRAGSARRERIAQTARALPTSDRATLESASRAAAKATGDSLGVTRRALRSLASDLVQPRRRAGPRGGSFALRAWTRGVGAGPIADRLKMTRAGAHRLINAERAARLRALDLRVPDGWKQVTRAESDPWLAHHAATVGLGAPGDTDAVPLAAAVQSRTAPDADRERALARAYITLRLRAAIGIAELGAAARGSALDHIETDLRWAALLKIELIRGERPLIVRTIEERAGAPLLDLPPAEVRAWIRAAFDSAAEAVDRFDPLKRGRLAAPISLMLARGLAGLEAHPSTRRAHATSLAIDDWARTVCPWQAWLDPPPRLRAVRDAVRARVLALRFGWHISPPRTIDDLKEHHGISPSEVWRAIAPRIASR